MMGCAACTHLAPSSTGGSSNVRHWRRGRHTISLIERFNRFNRSLQREPAHCNCELIEETHLSHQHWPRGAPLLQESDLGLPFDEDIIAGLAGGHEPKTRIGEFNCHRSAADPEV
jgi:hypothetical protein